MNLSTKLAGLKKRKAAKPASPAKGETLSSWSWAWLVLGAMAAGAGTLAFYEFILWNKVPPSLVGKWQVAEGPQLGGTFEFARDGNLVIQLKNQNKDYPPIQGSALLEGKTLALSLHNPLSREEKEQRSTIRQLTPNSLILEFENGDVLKMLR